MLLLTRMVLCPFRITLAILWPCGEADWTGSFPCLSPSLTTCSKKSHVKPLHHRQGMAWITKLVFQDIFYTLWFLLPQGRTVRELRNLPLGFQTSSGMSSPVHRGVLMQCCCVKGYSPAGRAADWCRVPPKCWQHCARQLPTTWNSLLDLC